MVSKRAQILFASCGFSTRVEPQRKLHKFPCQPLISGPGPQEHPWQSNTCKKMNHEDFRGRWLCIDTPCTLRRLTLARSRGQRNWAPNRSLCSPSHFNAPFQGSVASENSSDERPFKKLCRETCSGMHAPKRCSESSVGEWRVECGWSGGSGGEWMERRAESGEWRGEWRVKSKVCSPCVLRIVSCQTRFIYTNHVVRVYIRVRGSGQVSWSTRKLLVPP